MYTVCAVLDSVIVGLTIITSFAVLRGWKREEETH
jgi:hypothetical protein